MPSLPEAGVLVSYPSRESTTRTFMAVIRRDIASGWRDFTASFRSFDTCMEKRYCKIPFIVICIVGGIIVLSTLWCLLRCCLCGYRCCACCCGGCGGRREKKSKVDISPPEPALVTREPPAPEPLKYAYFDAHNDDALPIMPTLEDTKHVTVEVKVEEHELTPMKGAGTERSLTPAAQGLEREGRVPSPLQALRQADKRARTPAGGYRRDAQGDRSVAFGAPSPTSAYSSPTLPPAGGGYPEGGVHHQGRRREQYAGHNAGHNDYRLQQPQPQWENGAYRNTVQNAYGAYEANPYQAPQRPRQQQQQHQQQHQQLQPGQDTYYDQRKQPQEWTLV